MMYEDVIKDFAKRTRANLAAIEQLKANGVTIYETTQLINSCLGLLVFPRERDIENIEEIPLEELSRMGWPIPRVTEGSPQVKNLKELVTYLRNAIAHCNIIFIGDGHNEIYFLRVWNERRKNGPKNWEADLSVEDLRKFVDRFSARLIGGDS